MPDPFFPKLLLAILESRSIDDRRGFCLGVFHRVARLREGFIKSGSSIVYFRETEKMLWSRFKMAGDLTDLTPVEAELDTHLPREDDPLEFPLDLYATLCLSDVVESIATPNCDVTSDLLLNYSEIVQGTFQVLIHSGVTTEAIEKMVSQSPQVKREEQYLGELLDHSRNLTDAFSREKFECWVKEASAGDLWMFLRQEAARQGIQLKGL